MEKRLERAEFSPGDEVNLYIGEHHVNGIVEKCSDYTEEHPNGEEILVVPCFKVATDMGDVVIDQWHMWKGFKDETHYEMARF